MSEEKKTASIHGAARGSGSAKAGASGIASILGHAVRARPGGSSRDSLLSPENPNDVITRPIAPEEWEPIAKLFALEDEKARLISGFNFPPGYKWTISPREKTITFTRE